jgi:hypothetical protein
MHAVQVFLQPQHVLFVKADEAAVKTKQASMYRPVTQGTFLQA